MQATVSIFKNETHIDYFIDGVPRLIMTNPDGWDYDKVLSKTRRLVDGIGMAIDSEYQEINEFGDPITCFFAKSVTN